MKTNVIAGLATASALALLAGVSAVADDSSLSGRAQGARDRVEACATAHATTLRAPAAQRVRDIAEAAERHVLEVRADFEGAPARHRIEALNENAEPAELAREMPDFAPLAARACAEIEAAEVENEAAQLELEHQGVVEAQPVGVEQHGGSGSDSGSGH